MGVIDDNYTEGYVIFKRKVPDVVLDNISKLLIALDLKITNVIVDEKGEPHNKYEVYSSDYIDVSSLIEDLIPYYEYLEDVWISPVSVIYGDDKVALYYIEERIGELKDEL
jgi:hypothetical protein